MTSIDLVPPEAIRRRDTRRRLHRWGSRLGTGLAVSARAPDGVIEALEHPGLRYCLGVQWHPDADPGSAPIFSAFVEACAARRSAG